MIDLHCHSLFSDGTCSPEELLRLAEQAGLSALALTDHDTTAGLERFVAAGSDSPVETVPGIELSAEFDVKALHILGYFIDAKNTALQEVLERLRAGRSERNAQMLKRLNALGYRLSMEDVQKQAGDKLVGRPHFAAALMDRGYFKRPNKIYQQLLGKGRAAYVNRHRLSPEQCVELISRAGGVAVIAHPGQMRLTNNKLRRLIRRLLPHGLGGIEALHPSHRPHQVLAFERICAEFNLSVTGGTDFHGAVTPDLRLGTGFGSLQVPDHLLEAIRSRCQ